jgi:hypothetical protein
MGGDTAAFSFFFFSLFPNPEPGAFNLYYNFCVLSSVYPASLCLGDGPKSKHEIHSCRALEVILHNVLRNVLCLRPGFMVWNFPLREMFWHSEHFRS